MPLPKRPYRLLLTIAGFILGSLFPLIGAGAETPFNEEIRPLLSEHCFSCHGPDSASRKADLRLDTREGALASGVILPGDAEASELIARITSDDPEQVMPPPDFKKPLNDEQINRLANWINDGATWKKHWSFIKPAKSELPETAGVDAWARNPIDYFVFNRMQAAGWKPNPPADPHRLARRAAFDVTGLPPDEDASTAFLSAQNDRSFEVYVDTLLSSFHAGEHRARYWLDAARYGDTHGMHVDNYREIWPYRDWVIQAFNSNMPFDQFVIEQVAGDLLPNSNLPQKIATGFNRCNITTSEGGAIPEEVNVRYMVDRVETTATVFLGLTAGCAVCHDHKYDPLSQREFYQLGAFFNNTTQPAMDGNMKDTPPVVALPDPEYQTEWGELQQRRQTLIQQMRDTAEHKNTWWPSRNRSERHPIMNDQLLVDLPLTENERGEFERKPPTEWADHHPAGKRGVRFGEESQFSVEFPQLHSDQPLTVSFWLRTPERLTSNTIFKQEAKTKDDKTVGWQITTGTAGGLTFRLTDANGKSIQGRLPDNEALKPRAWQHICVRYSGGQSNSSVSILANGRAVALRNSSEAFVEPTPLADTPLVIAESMPTAGLSDIRIYRRWVSDQEARLLAKDFKLRHLINSDQVWKDLKDEERTLAENFQRHKYDENHQQLTREFAETQTRRDYIYSRSTTTLVMQELPSAPRAWVLARGEYTQPQEEVSPNVPAVLPSLPESAPQNRLGLALWLTNENHPLVARVMVNRLWQSVFGVGLVKTTEDFGVMGERPSHPELLDWLSVEFIESGWNINHMLKLMLTSATYRQSSVVSSAKAAQDPDNRLLARGPRLRLDAEALRDQALAVSGLLRRDIGGPSVKPYQPSGLWNIVAITGSNTRVFKADTGDALYRRSLYTFWKRTSPPPSLAAFNAPTREQCTVRRERTNTPLQALILMNDPQFVEAARHLAEAAIQQIDDDRERVQWMLEKALARPANQQDVSELVDAASAFMTLFDQDTETATSLINTGDSPPNETISTHKLATWTMIANTIMNRDDFINK